MKSEISYALKSALFSKYCFVMTVNHVNSDCRTEWFYCEELQTTVISVQNFHSCVIQYYIEDINE